MIKMNWYLNVEKYAMIFSEYHDKYTTLNSAKEVDINVYFISEYIDQSKQNYIQQEDINVIQLQDSNKIFEKFTNNYQVSK